MSDHRVDRASLKRYGLYVLCVVVLAVGLMYGVYRYANRVIIDSNIASMRELAEHDKQAMNVSLANRVAAAENLGDSLANQSILSIQGLHESLNAANYQLKTKKLYLLGSDGRFYSSNGTAKPDAVYAELVAANPEGFMQRIASTDPRLDDGILVIGRPISALTIEGIRFSYIITETKLRDLSSELIISSYQDRGRTMIVDMDGNYIVSDPSVLGENTREILLSRGSIAGGTMEEYLRRIRTEPETSATFTLDGASYICLTSRTEQGWLFITYCPTSVFAQESNRLTLLFVGLAIVIAVGVAVVLVLTLRDRSRRRLQEQYDAIRELNAELEERQAQLEEATAEQESQIEEITALNGELEERQQQLEEATAEQESQIEEITALNAELEERQAQLEEVTAEQEAHITEINDLNRSLTANRDRLQATISDLEETTDIFAAAGYGIWRFLFGPDGNVCGLVGNAKWSEIFGVRDDRMTPEERLAYFTNGLDGKSESTVHDDYADMREGMVRSRVFTWSHPEKGTIYVSVGGTRHVAPSGEVQISGFVADVTEASLRQQRQNDELVEAGRRAEAANNAKTTFLFNMSHDIRTPMNAILGFTQLIGKAGPLSEQQADYLRKIENSGQFLLSVINNVLDMARIESGKLELDEVFVDLLNEDNKTDTMLTSELQKKQLHYTTSISVEHRYVYADTAKTAQVMMNLLSNAIKYTPAGGSIHLDFSEVDCDRPGYARFVTTLTDNGIGMSREFQAQIFDSFTREKTSTENKVVGTGLGMAIVKKLIDLMGGTIELQSELGKGTTFIVTTDFRIVEDPELFLKKKTVEREAHISLEGRRILLAEDNDLNAEIATMLLEDAGIRVERAADGVICVDMVEKAAPGYYDLILMDIQMPNLNGYRATEKLRRAGFTLPIIAMTANAFDEDRQNALRAGMNGHLGKPIDVAALMKALQSTLG